MVGWLAVGVGALIHRQPTNQILIPFVFGIGVDYIYTNT